MICTTNNLYPDVSTITYSCLYCNFKCDLETDYNFHCNTCLYKHININNIIIDNDKLKIFINTLTYFNYFNNQFKKTKNKYFKVDDEIIKLSNKINLDETDLIEYLASYLKIDYITLINITFLYKQYKTNMFKFLKL